jgi:hypothetical protein
MGTSRVITPSMASRIAAGRAEGRSNRALADELGIDRRSLDRFVARHGGAGASSPVQATQASPAPRKPRQRGAVKELDEREELLRLASILRAQLDRAADLALADLARLSSELRACAKRLTALDAARALATTEGADDRARWVRERLERMVGAPTVDAGTEDEPRKVSAR